MQQSMNKDDRGNKLSPKRKAKKELGVNQDNWVVLEIIQKTKGYF